MPANSRRYHSAALRPAGVEIIQHFQLLTPNRRLNLVEPQIVSDFFVQVFVLAAMVAKHGDQPGDFIVLRGDRAAVAIDGQVLAWIETEGGMLGIRSGPLALPFCAVRLRAILDDPKSVIGGKLHDRIEIRGPAI